MSSAYKAQPCVEPGALLLDCCVRYMESSSLLALIDAEYLFQIVEICLLTDIVAVKNQSLRSTRHL